MRSIGVKSPQDGSQVRSKVVISPQDGSQVRSKGVTRLQGGCLGRRKGPGRAGRVPEAQEKSRTCCTGDKPLGRVQLSGWRK